jgi:hypothetical protein
MTVQDLTYSEEEFADRGRGWYETQIRSQVDPKCRGQIVAIDVETGEFELGQNTLSAAKLLLSRLPEAQMWFVRVGHVAVHRVGFAGSTLES